MRAGSKWQSRLNVVIDERIYYGKVKGFALFKCTEISKRRRRIYVAYITGIEKQTKDGKRISTLVPGQCVCFRGEWDNECDDGEGLKDRFQAKDYKKLDSSIVTAENGRLILKQMALTGLDEQDEIERFFDMFGAKSFDALHNVGMLQSFGLQSRKAAKNAEAWDRVKQFVELSRPLLDIGVPGYACYAAWQVARNKTIYADVMQRIVKNPYLLVSVVRCMSFKEIDETIAALMEILPEDSRRCQALIIDALLNTHDTYLTVDHLIEIAGKNGISEEKIDSVINDMLTAQNSMISSTAWTIDDRRQMVIMLQDLSANEEYIIRKIYEMATDKTAERYDESDDADWENAPDYVEDVWKEDTLSATNGDYSPGNPWDAPGMSISDFI